MQPSLRPRRPARLKHRLAASDQHPRQAGAVAVGALDRPDTAASSEAVRELERQAVADSVGTHRPLSEKRPRPGRNDHQRVLVAVRIDTDHVVQLVCKHPTRSSDRS